MGIAPPRFVDPNGADAEEEQIAGLELPQPERRLTELAVPEHSHVGESQSNGASERAVQLVEDLARTLKSALEERIGWTIPATHALMQWLLRHASYLLTK